MRYVPYVKYVLAPDTRFERDATIFFDPRGEVSQGKMLVNYGWNQTGFKELIEAFYYAKEGNTSGFDKYFENRIRNESGNIMDILRTDGLVGDQLRGLVRIDLRQNMAIPALLAEYTNIRYKKCLKPVTCSRLWKASIPNKLKHLLDKLNLTIEYISKFRCTRHLCYHRCGAYKQCILMYTSKEDEAENEARIEDCIVELVKQTECEAPGSTKYQCRSWTAEDHKTRKIGSLKPDTKCFERPVRFDFKPIRYYILDPETWKRIERGKHSTNTRNQFDAFPESLLPYIFDDRFIESTELSAPLRAPGILESFLQLADIKFEIKYSLEKRCDVCKSIHRITRIPIKAMFKKDEVFRHEAGFAELLWDALWSHHTKEMCGSFGGLTHISSEKSPILKRELRVQELAKSPYGMCSYDYALYTNKLALNRKKTLLFDLTTALWKKSGFHEEARSPEEHLDVWRETLCRIPNKVPDLVATWYIVRNETEDTFFDETAPGGAENIDQLIDLVSDQFPGTAKIIRQPSDLASLDIDTIKLLIVPVFNSTPAKGEARHELRRLPKKKFSDLLIRQVVDFLLT